MMIASLKELKSLDHFTVDLEQLAFINHHDLNELIKALKPLRKGLVLNIEDRTNVALYGPELPLQRLCQVIRKIDKFLKIEIKLSLPQKWKRFPQQFKILMKTCSKLTYFSSIDLEFSEVGDFGLFLEVLSILKGSRSLSRLSLYLNLYNLSPIGRSRDLFKRLKEIKSLKNVKIHLKNSDSLTYLFLKNLKPIFKGAAQKFNIDVTFENVEKYSAINVFEWWLSERSIRNLDAYHKVQAKFIGKKQLFFSDLVNSILLLSGFVSSMYLIGCGIYWLGENF